MGLNQRKDTTMKKIHEIEENTNKHVLGVDLSTIDAFVDGTIIAVFTAGMVAALSFFC